jgi:hypothetical protein
MRRSMKFNRSLLVEFDELDPPPSEIERLDERIKLDFAIHDLEWSTATEMTYAKSA